MKERHCQSRASSLHRRMMRRVITHQSEAEVFSTSKTERNKETLPRNDSSCAYATRSIRVMHLSAAEWHWHCLWRLTSYIQANNKHCCQPYNLLWHNSGAKGTLHLYTYKIRIRSRNNLHYTWKNYNQASLRTALCIQKFNQSRQADAHVQTTSKLLWTSMYHLLELCMMGIFTGICFSYGFRRWGSRGNNDANLIFERPQ